MWSEVTTTLFVDAHPQVFIDGGGITPFHSVGAYIGAPHTGHDPTCVYMLNTCSYLFKHLYKAFYMLTSHSQRSPSHNAQSHAQDPLII